MLLCGAMMVSALVLAWLAPSVWTLGLASAVYLTLLRLFPEPAAVYGPTDPRSLRIDARTAPTQQHAT